MIFIICDPVVIVNYFRLDVRSMPPPLPASSARSIPAHRGARPLDPLLLLLLVATSITAAALGGPAWMWSRMGVSNRRR